MIRRVFFETLAEEFEEYIDANSSQAEIIAEFHVFRGNVLYEVGYKIVLDKTEKGVEIHRTEHEAYLPMSLVIPWRLILCLKPSIS